jgi:hypothetical protein
MGQGFGEQFRYLGWLAYDGEMYLSIYDMAIEEFISVYSELAADFLRFMLRANYALTSNSEVSVTFVSSSKQ